MRRVLAALAFVLVAAGVAAAPPWAWLGVRIRDLSEQEMEEIASRHGIREGFGVVVVDVLEGTPAARAGLKPGDVVVAFEDRPVTETRLLQQLIAAAAVDAAVRLTVLRPEGRRPVPVRLAAMPKPVRGERVAAEFGFALGDSDGQGYATVRRASSPSVAFVMRGSAAERAGLEVGDVILQIGDRAVVSRDAAREALGDVVLDGPLRLTVRRGAEHVSLEMSPLALRP